MKKLRSLWKIIFGRTTVLILLMLAQAVVLFGGFAVLDSSIWAINYIVTLLAVIILMYVVNARQNSSFKLMWIVLILAVPVVGVVFYIYTKLQYGTRFISHRLKELTEETEEYLIPKRETANEIFAA